MGFLQDCQVPNFLRLYYGVNCVKLLRKDVIPMIPFERLDLNNKARYDVLLMHCGHRGCEHSFVNKFLWGRQKAAFLNGQLRWMPSFWMPGNGASPAISPA